MKEIHNITAKPLVTPVLIELLSVESRSGTVKELLNNNINVCLLRMCSSYSK